MRDKHLEFIQNIINRMANNSFILKGWSVTLATGIIWFSWSSSVTNLIYLALLPVLIFWGLDAYYLRQERLFRKLYEHSIKNRKRSEYLSLNTEICENKVNSWFRTLFSSTLLVLHGAIILVIIVIGYMGGI
ncbi:MAG: hypothetical protein HZB67_03395 [Candidatus Aenigmarchaeota archaeon]|nr:hypothetical protein [Candidatus Aenigmarchaeota archaeon]